AASVPSRCGAVLPATGGGSAARPEGVSAGVWARGKGGGISCLACFLLLHPASRTAKTRTPGKSPRFTSVPHCSSSCRPLNRLGVTAVRRHSSESANRGCGPWELHHHSGI